MGSVLAAGPTSSLICFYSGDPLTPQGSLERAPNGSAGRRPITRCLFSNQITIFNGDTRARPSPNGHLFEIAPCNYFMRKPPPTPTPVHHTPLTLPHSFVCCCLFSTKCPSLDCKWPKMRGGVCVWGWGWGWGSGSWNRCHRGMR